MLIEVVFGRHAVTDKLLARQGYAYNAEVPVGVGDIVSVAVDVVEPEEQVQEATVVRVAADVRRYGYRGPVSTILDVVQRAR